MPIHLMFLLQYNDNSGNPYSDAHWLAALVQSISDLKFGSQVQLIYLLFRLFLPLWPSFFAREKNISLLHPLLKRMDRLLLFDRLVSNRYFLAIWLALLLTLCSSDSLMPSHNSILTISCIRTLAQIAFKLSSYVPPVSLLSSLFHYPSDL